MSSIPINSLKTINPTVTEKAQDARMKEVAELYDKQFLREMVKVMRSTVESGGLTEPSMAEGIFREKLDHEYVENWGTQGGIGLSDVIFKQLKERFGGGPRMFTPQGPVPVDRGTHFKVDETKPFGIPVVPAGEKQTGKDLTYQIKVGTDRTVTSPWAGEVLQTFATNDERQTLKIAHDNGLVSTLHFCGRSEALKIGDQIAPGQKLGQVNADQGQLTWQLVQVLPS